MEKIHVDVKMVYDFLKGYQLMALATYGEYPWIANLYYVVKPDLTIYFLSRPTRIHCLHIAANPLVACSIFDSNHTPIKQKQFTKIGVQISGVARLLEKDAEVHEAIELWKKAMNLVSDSYTLEGIKQDKIDGRMYEVKPKKVRLFHDSLDQNNLPLLEL